MLQHVASIPQPTAPNDRFPRKRSATNSLRSQSQILTDFETNLQSRYALVWRSVKRSHLNEDHEEDTILRSVQDATSEIPTLTWCGAGKERHRSARLDARGLDGCWNAQTSCFERNQCDSVGREIDCQRKPPDSLSDDMCLKLTVSLQGRNCVHFSMATFFFSSNDLGVQAKP